MMRFAVDTGGTFTDLVVEEDSGKLHMFKSFTTTHDPALGIMNAVQLAAERMSLGMEELLGQCEIFIHGTTHATNAVITGNTARTALLTTRGHPDILVIREGGRIEPFNFSVPFQEPYVPRSLTFEVPERINSEGQVIEPLDEKAVVDIIGRLKELNVEAVAVCLLWSTVNPIHEKRVGKLFESYMDWVPFTLSSQLNPILREYRRASSAAIDASLKPLMSRYLGGLSNRLKEVGFSGRLLMLTSKGGIMDFEDMASAPIYAIGSGPSMAPIAGRHFAQLDTHADMAIVADTGGAAASKTDAWLTICHAGNAGMSFIDSFELDELHFPLLVKARHLVPDTEGAGRTVGAPSGYCEYGPIGNENLEVVYVADGAINSAKGTRGGHEGARNQNYLRAKSGELKELPPCGDIILQSGETIISYCAGGGGYGPPHERPVEKVKRDVEEEWITRERAEEVYGVVLDGEGNIDEEGTKKRRRILSNLKSH